MNSDPKVSFYLEHRELIEEWASLRDVAARELSSALERACRAEQLSGHRSAIVLGPDHPSRRTLQFTPPRKSESTSYVELLWKPTQLCIPGDPVEWPVLSIVVNPYTALSLREPIRRAAGPIAAEHGLAWSDHKWWVLSRQLEPASPMITPDEYAAECMRKVRTLYDAVAEVLTVTVRRFEAGEPDAESSVI